MKVYLVGGAVRDKLMGKMPNDFDFSVVLDAQTDLFVGGPDGEINPFESMKANLIKMGFKIFLSTPEHLTVRAQFPVGSGGFLDGMTNIPGGAINPGKKRLTADFVLARREGAYADGRRPDSVIPGTLMDDLKRRDLTFNAIAQDEDGSLIDPFNGQQDIKDKIIRAVGDPLERLMEDSLRALRAVRFRSTLGFHMEPQLHHALNSTLVLRALANVSDERKMDELNKMFKHDTLRALWTLDEYKLLRNVVFSGKVNLLATMQQKGYNK